MSQEKLIPADQTKCAELRASSFVQSLTIFLKPSRKRPVRHILDSIGAGTAGAIAPETTILTQTLHAAGKAAAPLRFGDAAKNDPAQCRPRQRHRLSCF